MSGTCKDCRYWIPPDPGAHPKSVEGMGYGVCDEISGSDIQLAGPPPAIHGYENCDFLTQPHFGCNQFEAKD